MAIHVRVIAGVVLDPRPNPVQDVSLNGLAYFSETWTYTMPGGSTCTETRNEYVSSQPVPEVPGKTQYYVYILYIEKHYTIALKPINK